MTQNPYEFAKRFEKAGLKSETFSIVPTTKEKQKRMDEIKRYIKKYIDECERAYQTPKKPTIRFCQKKFLHTR